MLKNTEKTQRRSVKTITGRKPGFIASGDTKGGNMKTIIIQWYWWLIPLVLIWLFICRTTISLKPFRIHIEAPALMVGVMLIWIGIILVLYQVRKDAKDEAYKEIIELIEKKDESK